MDSEEVSMKEKLRAIETLFSALPSFSSSSSKKKKKNTKKSKKSTKKSKQLVDTDTNGIFLKIMSIIDGVDYTEEELSGSTSSSCTGDDNTPDLVFCSNMDSSSSSCTALTESFVEDDQNFSCSADGSSLSSYSTIQRCEHSLISILKKKNKKGSAVPKRSPSQARFAFEMNEIYTIPKKPLESLRDLFYDDDEIAAFRHAAFCEETGMSPNGEDKAKLVRVA